MGAQDSEVQDTSEAQDIRKGYPYISNARMNFDKVLLNPKTVLICFRTIDKAVPFGIIMGW